MCAPRHPAKYEKTPLPRKGLPRAGRSTRQIWGHTTRPPIELKMCHRGRRNGHLLSLYPGGKPFMSRRASCGPHIPKANRMPSAILERT